MNLHRVRPIPGAAATGAVTPGAVAGISKVWEMLRIGCATMGIVGCGSCSVNAILGGAIRPG